MEKVKEISDEKKKAKRKELDEKIMKKVQLKRTENPESVKSQQNSRTQMCREKMKAKDQEAVKRAQNCQRQENREKKKNEDHETVKRDQNCQRKKNRKGTQRLLYHVFCLMVFPFEQKSKIFSMWYIFQ